MSRRINWSVDSIRSTVIRDILLPTPAIQVHGMRTMDMQNRLAPFSPDRLRALWSGGCSAVFSTLCVSRLNVLPEVG
jgi:hypothetical protein